MAAIRNVAMHFEQQPLNVRREFGIERMETGREKRTYLEWWNTRFPRLFPVLHHLMNVNIDALAPFYTSKFDVDLSCWWSLSSHVRSALQTSQFSGWNSDPIGRLKRHLNLPDQYGRLHLTREWMEWSERFFDSEERLQLS